MKSYGRKLLRKKLNEIRTLSKYIAGESTNRATQRSKVNPSEVLKLNANENLFIPKEKVIMFLKEVIEEVDPRLYPQEVELEVKETLSKYLGVSTECIMVGNGSDPLIALITQLFLERNEDALSVAPTFALYKLLADLQGAKYFGVPLKNDFSLDLEKILANVTSKTRMFFLCSPNNPTANQFEAEKVQTLIEEFPGVVIIDEAYVEFGDYSTVHLAEKNENQIVVRTFSKAFSLAGLRFGYLVSNPELATTLSEKVQLPYPVNSITLKMGLKLLKNVEIVNEAVKQMKKERRRIIKVLNNINGIRVFNSQANFILFQSNKGSDEVFRELLTQGVLIRNLGKVPSLDRCLRVTIGLPEMNDKFLAAIERVFEG